MDVELFTDPAAFDALEPEWRALWDRDPAATVFHTPEYARVEWETELGADRDLAVIALRDGGDLVGLANLTVEPDETLRFLGNAAVTDYLGPISSPADRERVATATIERACDLEGWSRGELLCLAADTGWPEALTRAAKASGLAVAEARHDVCPRVAIGGSYEAYLESLNPKLRHEVRRKARRLEREAGPFAIRLSRADRLERDLDAFFEMHRSSEGQKGKFMHDDMAELFRRLCRVFDRREWLRLAWLDVADEPLAATLSFSARGVWSVWNSAYDHRKRDLGPGMVLMAETIRLAAEEGCHTVDLLRGDEPYKYRFGATDVALIRLDLGKR